MRTSAMVVLNRIATRRWVGRVFAGLGVAGFLGVQACGSAGTLEDSDQYQAGVDEALKKGRLLDGSGGSPAMTGGSPGVTGGSGGSTGGSPAVTGGSGGGGNQGTGCGSMNVPAGCANGDQLIMTHCSGCHNAQGAPQFSTIDFITDPKTALVGKPAAYTGVPGGGCPVDKEILLDANNFDQSLFVTKVRGSGFACGALMPYPAANPRPQAEAECIVAWACGLLKN